MVGGRGKVSGSHTHVNLIVFFITPQNSSYNHSVPASIPSYRARSLELQEEISMPLHLIFPFYSTSPLIFCPQILSLYSLLFYTFSFFAFSPPPNFNLHFISVILSPSSHSHRRRFSDTFTSQARLKKLWAYNP